MASQGDQNVTFSYRDNLTNYELNRVYTGLFDIGVYSGFSINPTGNTTSATIVIDTGVLCIEDGSGSGSIFKIETTQPITLLVNNLNTIPYIICRYNFTAIPFNPSFAQFLTVSLGQILPTDIILGLVKFNITSVSGIDYSVRQNGTIPTLSSVVNGLKVTADGTLTVTVSSGTIMNGSESYSFPTETPLTLAIGPSAPNYRTDLIVVDMLDTVPIPKVIQGTPVFNPLTYTQDPPDYGMYIVLAEVFVNTNYTSNIYQKDITDVRDFTKIFYNNISDSDAIKAITSYSGVSDITFLYGDGTLATEYTPVGFIWEQVYTATSNSQYPSPTYNIMVTEKYKYDATLNGGSTDDIDYVTYIIKSNSKYGFRTIKETFYYYNGNINRVVYS